jgi:hypothetical protein
MKSDFMEAKSGRASAGCGTRGRYSPPVGERTAAGDALPAARGPPASAREGKNFTFINLRFFLK